MAIPSAALPLGASVLSSALGAANPLSMLASPLAGGLQGGDAAPSNAVQDQLFNMPFNVGSGSLSADADKKGGSASGVGGADLSQFIPVIIMGIVAWAAVSLLK